MNLTELNICLETLKREHIYINDIISTASNPISDSADYSQYAHRSGTFDYKVEEGLKIKAEIWRDTEEGQGFLRLTQKRDDIERRIELIHSLLIDHVLTLEYKID